MPRPTLIVGDVQGDAERLREALEPFPEDEVDTMFLGDFFQGGPPGAAGGAAAARIARDRRNSRSILGNHDVFLLCILEERRDGFTPSQLTDRGHLKAADVWLDRRGDWADLDAVMAEPGLEAWIRTLPLMLRLDDRTLVQHADHDAYAELGTDCDGVNAAARSLLSAPRGVWSVFRYLIGRHAFNDHGRLHRYLDHFGASRLVHGHTPHHGAEPSIGHQGRILGYDGCFSRYWTHHGDGSGPIGATVALLPPLNDADDASDSDRRSAGV